jgi:hypothetical protein
MSEDTFVDAAFDTLLADAFRRYAADAPTEVEPYELTRAVSAAHPRRGAAARIPGMRLAQVPAWLLLVGMLIVAVGALAVGGALLRFVETPVMPVPTVGPPAVAPPAPAPTSTPAASSVPSDAAVADLAVGPDGAVWAATGRGVVHWDPFTGTSTRYGQADGLVATGVEHVAVGADGVVWVDAPGWLARFDGRWTSFTEFGGIQVSEIGDVAIGPGGTLWVAARTGGPASSPALLRYDGTWSAIPIPDDLAPIASLAVGPNGTVWAGTFLGPGVVAWEGRGWKTYTRENAGLPGVSNTPAVAPDGTVWVSLPPQGCRVTADSSVTCDVPAAGVARFDGSTWTAYTTADGLGSDEAYPVVGPDGTVWAIGDSVASRFDGARWTAYGADIQGAGPWNAAVAPDGSLWFGTPTGVARFDGSVVTRLAAPETPPPAGLPPLTLVPQAEPAVIQTALGDMRWQVFEVPLGHGLWPNVAATRFGLVAMDGPDLRWSVDGGTTWQGTTLSMGPGGLSPAGDDLVVYGAGAVRLAWDGERWTEAGRLEFAGPVVGGIEQVVTGPRGTVMTTWSSAGPSVLFSADGQHFVPAVRGPDPAKLTQNVPTPRACLTVASGAGSGSIGAVLATADGFVALTPVRPGDWANRPDCSPVLWFSADGLTWDLVDGPSPFGTDAWVTGVAARGGRFVAVGGTGSGHSFNGAYSPNGALWVSDDAVTWTRGSPYPPGAADASYVIAAGELGWMFVAGSGGGWVSTDGLAWQPLPGGRPAMPTGYLSPQAAVGPNAVVVGGWGLAGGGASVELLAVGTTVP